MKIPSCNRTIRQYTIDAYGSLEEQFEVLGELCDMVSQTDLGLKDRVEEAYYLGFRGDAGQPMYFIGASMAREIEADFGSDALICVISMPADQFVLAYAYSFSVADRLETSYKIADSPLAAALNIAKLNNRENDFMKCLP